MESETQRENISHTGHRHSKVKLGVSGTLVTLLIYTLVVAIGGYYVGTFLSQMKQAQQPVKQSQNEAYITTTPIPTTPITESPWKAYSVDELGLSFSAPSDLDIQYHVDVTEETGEPYLLTLYIQNNDATNYYQLYGIFQWNTSVADNLDDFKSGLEETSIEDSTVSGMPALKGQIRGERNRFVTYILLPDGVLSLFTAEPTLENKELSDEIIDTFVFTN